MSDMISVLAFYYLCDAIGPRQGLSHSEMHRCMRNYQTLKSHFASERAAEDAPHLSGYRAFKAWEQANADLVANLREEAAAQVR